MPVMCYFFGKVGKLGLAGKKNLGTTNTHLLTPLTRGNTGSFGLLSLHRSLSGFIRPSHCFMGKAKLTARQQTATDTRQAPGHAL